MRLPLSFNRDHSRRAIIVATNSIPALEKAWEQTSFVVCEAHTTDGLHALLPQAALVVVDWDALHPIHIAPGYLQGLVAQVPHTDSAGFLANPEHWLREGQAFKGDLHSLPPRLAAFTSLASGGVGKTTLTICLAAAVARRTRLPVAIVELTHAASGFLAMLDPERFQSPPVDAYAAVTQAPRYAPRMGGHYGGQAGSELGRWEGITVVPMEGRQAALLTGESFADLLDRLHGSHALTIVDAARPHPLWPAVQERADRVFVVAAAPRPDTIVNAELDLEENRDERFCLLINQASRLDMLASQRSRPDRPVITVPQQAAIAHFRHPMPQLTAALWPSSRIVW